MDSNKEGVSLSKWGGNDLPKLPLPPLEQTMEKYLIAMQPLTTPSQMERLKTMVKTFSSGPGAMGPRLQLYLEQQREQKDNWAYEYWLNDMYLNNPAPLPVNSNPGMIFPPRKFTTIHDIARLAARMLDVVLDHKETLDAKALPQEKATSREKGQPLCMSQYYRLLTSCRVPGKVRDSIVSNLEPEPKQNINEHVIVACRNQFYCVPLKAVDRGRLNEHEICSQFLHILNDAPCLATKPPPVGILTADNRQKWAEVRETLIEVEQNRRNLELIEKSLLIVCLDEPLPVTFNRSSSSIATDWSQRAATGHNVNGRDETNMMCQMIHGGGSSFNSANRWFDKTIQIVISNDGVCGLSYEHSPSEGTAVVQLMDNLIKRSEDLVGSGSSTVAPTSDFIPPPERLEWKLDARQLRSIQDASTTLDSICDDLNVVIYRFNAYGKNFIKSCQVSPDAYIQLALQLTYFKIYGHLVHTYESAATRRFRLGRVDCIRSATQEALEWARAMCQTEGVSTLSPGDAAPLGESDKEQKLELWKKALAHQTEIMIDNIMGQGIDIHLLGLREAARETAPTASSPLPELFTDDIYKKSNLFPLSTSQVPTASDSVLGYGAVVPDGYGASYNPHADTIVFCISCFNSSDATNTNKFAHNLEESLLAMQELLKN